MILLQRHRCSLKGTTFVTHFEFSRRLVVTDSHLPAHFRHWPAAAFLSLKMSGYVKLFSEIVDSSIWEEPHEIRIVWITLLALCDCDGYVRGSSGWLAGKARVTTTACELALEKFKAPDPRSRTPDNDGKRIEQLEDGWLVLNYIAFRDRLSTNPKTVATRERVRKHRESVT